jgi:DNA repair protein RAD50
LIDKQLQQVNNDPRRTEIPVEIRQLEDKIDKLKRELDDDKMALTTLRHSADTQNTIDILQEQCAKDLEVLQDSMKEQSYLMQKYNLQLTNALLNADDDADGKQIVAVVMALSDSVKDKFDTADTNLSRAQDALAKAQQIFSEKAALLKTKQQSVASLKGKCDPLFGAIAKVRKVLESIEKKEPGVSFNNEPRLILDYLDEKLKALEDDAPGTVSPDVIKKVFKRLKKLVRPALMRVISTFGSPTFN